MKRIVILDYGAGNVRSLQYALERLGLTALHSAHKDDIRQASHVLFPGVGHAAPAMEALKKSGLDSVIPTLTQPVLGICLGMQLLCAHSAEGNTPGLGVFDTPCLAFKDNISRGLSIPHIGWNVCTQANNNQLTANLPDRFYQYFVHSYYVPLCPYTTLESEYGIRFSAGLNRGNFWGVQFHPEKGSTIGNQILTQFLSL
jgi:glutamine amidotransferase